MQGNRQSLSELKLALELIADGIIAVDESMKIIAYNRSFIEMFDIPEEFLVRQQTPKIREKILSLVKEPDLVFRQIQEAYQSPDNIVHLAIEMKDGRTFDLYTRAHRTEKPGMIRTWSYRDITAECRARAQVELAEKRSHFLSEVSLALGSSLDFRKTTQILTKFAIQEYADWCTVSLEEGGRARIISTSNRGGAGGAVDAPVDRNTLEVIRTGRLMYVRDATDEILKQASSTEEYYQWVRYLGIRSFIVAPLIARGRCFGAVAFVNGEGSRIYDQDDVSMATEIAHRSALAIDNARLYSESQQAIEVRDEFISIASHELRTPLTPLKMQLQLIRRYLTGPEVEAFPKYQNLVRALQRSSQQLERLSRLVEDLLDVSRITAGRLLLNLEEFDFVDLVKEVVSESASDATSAHCAIRINAVRPVIGLWDRTRMERVVSNLLSNAIKYGSGKPIDLTITQNERSGESFARIAVHDRGIGIAKKDQSRIFERFERAASLKTYGGFGLGLYISRQIVASHGGEIRVQSEPGAGSTFFVEVPARVARVRPLAA